jgi:hypothetical protein
MVTGFAAIKLNYDHGPVVLIQMKPISFVDAVCGLWTSDK